MSPFWWGLIVGIILGADLALLVFALFHAAASADRAYGLRGKDLHARG